MILEQHYEDIRTMASKFSDEVVAPLAKEIDHEGFIPKEIIQKMAENGFFGVFIPEEYGGAGMDYLSYAIICEEISRGCASSGVMISAHNSLCVYPILTYGNAQQKKNYLPRLASGEWIGCFCLSEPNAGSDAGSLTTFAEDKGDHYLLNGTKNYITNGKEASIAVVFAKTKKRDDYTGISTFIVEMNSPGISIPKLEDKLGIRGSSTAQIFFDQVKVPKENLLGVEEKGFRIAMSTLDGGRIGIAAQAIGIAQAAFSFAKQYALQRVQFKAPIAQLQAIQMMIADMSVKISASRLLMNQAGLLKVAGKSHTKEAASAKLFASEACMWITTKAIQICGGNGYTKEYPVERHFRDAKITEIYEGTSEVQRLVIAANELKS